MDLTRVLGHNPCVPVVAMKRGLISSLSQEDPKASALQAKKLCLPPTRGPRGSHQQESTTSKDGLLTPSLSCSLR